MLFKRRVDPDLSERVRVMLWPRRGWRRSSQYMYKRILRLSGTPHVIALGCAAGIFASFTPYIGFHFIIGMLVAWAIGGNIIASAFGTFFGNPITFPFIWTTTYKVGMWAEGASAQKPRSIEELMNSIAGPVDLVRSAAELLPLLKPMTIGGVALGVPIALLCYFPARAAVDAYQRRRRNFLRARTPVGPDGAGHGS